jgi:hypothetical protein
MIRKGMEPAALLAPSCVLPRKTGEEEELD